MRELFIYWRTSEPAAALQAVLAWQAQLRCEHPALRTALYQRRDEAGATTTVMEVYAGAALSAAVEAQIASEGDRRLRRWLQGARKVEAFAHVPDG